MHGSVVLVPVLNVPAFEAAQRGNPLDTFSYDLNRIYPGKADGYLTERLAHIHSVWLREVATYEISIHSGGAHSYLSETIFATTDDKAIELAQAMGRRGFERAQQFQWSRTAQAVHEAFRQAIDERAARSRGGRDAVS